MKNAFLAALLLLPGFFAQAQNFAEAREAVEIRSLVDLGICTDAGSGRVARFLDGDRLKIEHFDYGDTDHRWCRVRHDGPTFKSYVCSTDAWDITRHLRGDIEVEIHVGRLFHSVQLSGRSFWKNEVLVKGNCVPHRY